MARAASERELMFGRLVLAHRRFVVQWWLSLHLVSERRLRRAYDRLVDSEEERLPASRSV